MKRPKVWHEVRCPLHGFIRFNNLERKLINSAPLQRLKYIHQLAMTYQVYPGATHRRFEHSLGVMELVSRAFDALMRDDRREHGAEAMPEAVDANSRAYWRQVLRVAALTHDTGHLPFSHAAEKELLPPGWSHESLTREIIRKSEVTEILASGSPPVRPDDVLKLALDDQELTRGRITLSPWEALLNSLITGGTFGADRMDYLLRDSLHAGVSYGRYDSLRLIDSLVILEQPVPGDAEEDASPSGERLTIGVFQGGVQGVEALLLARYFMFTQVYFHDVRRAYDGHLIDFLRALFPDGSYPTAVASHLGWTDNEVLAEMRKASGQPSHPGYDPARRIMTHDHFRTAYTFTRADLDLNLGGNPNAGELLRKALAEKFGAQVRVDFSLPKRGSAEVFVLTGDGKVVSGRDESDLLGSIPSTWFGYVLCDPVILEKVIAYVREKKSELLQTQV